MRKEIEVKARVGDKEMLLSNLAKAGVELSEPIVQNDEIFVDENYGDFLKFNPGKNVLRIREAKGKFLFTLKQPQANELDCIERETEIVDPVEFREALLLMGYKSVVKVNKVRRKAKHGDYEICVDEVENLGSFVEVEKITDDENADKVQQELFSFLQTLGVQKEDQVTRGYDTLIYLKMQGNV